MNRFKAYFTLAFVALLCLGFTSSFAAESTARKGVEAGAIKLAAKGDTPITFTLENLEGEKVALESMLGKKSVVLIFWSLFCGPCQEELPLVDKLGKKYKEQGLEVLSINLDGKKRAKAVKKYMKKKGYTFQVLWEQVEGISYVTADAYGIQGTPTMVVIGKGGKVSFVHVGQEKEEKMEEVFQASLAE